MIGLVIKNKFELKRETKFKFSQNKKLVELNSKNLNQKYLKNLMKLVIQIQVRKVCIMFSIVNLNLMDIMVAAKAILELLPTLMCLNLIFY